MSPPVCAALEMMSVPDRWMHNPSRGSVGRYPRLNTVYTLQSTPDWWPRIAGRISVTDVDVKTNVPALYSGSYGRKRSHQHAHPVYTRIVWRLEFCTNVCPQQSVHTRPKSTAVPKDACLQWTQLGISLPTTKRLRRGANNLYGQGLIPSRKGAWARSTKATLLTAG